MVERDLLLLKTLNNLGQATITQFVAGLRESGVETNSKELGHWLFSLLGAGFIERTGSAGSFEKPGYHYKVTLRGKRFMEKELKVVEDMLAEPSTPEPGITDAIKDEESTKGKKEPSLAHLAGGGLLVCLSFLALYAGVDPGFRKILENWWTKQVGQKPKETPPETPSGLTV